MIDDPIVAEVRRTREAHARRYNWDIRAIFADLMEREVAKGGAVHSASGSGAGEEKRPAGSPITAPSDSLRPFWETERDEIQRALTLCRGNVQEVARRLEISPATLYRKIEKYGLTK